MKKKTFQLFGEKNIYCSTFRITRNEREDFFFENYFAIGFKTAPFTKFIKFHFKSESLLNIFLN